LAVAPVGSVLLAAAVGADFVAVDDLAAVAAGAAAAGAADAAALSLFAAALSLFAAAALGAFCMPPWPLHVPLPVDVEVVPSLHVVGAGSAARLGMAKANISKGAAMSPVTVMFFMNVHSLV
jgi:hypothetical protein